MSRCSTQIAYRLDGDEKPYGGVWANPGTVSDNVEFFINAGGVAFRMEGRLTEHGLALRDLLASSLRALDRSLMTAAVLAEAEAREENFQRDCQRLVSECELEVDRRIEARVL